MTSEPQEYADRSYRSGPAIAGGVLLLGLAAWMGGDALLRGEGRVPLYAIAGLLTVVPLIVALTVRPVVLAGDNRVLIRNPFRTIHVPWGAVETVRARYSAELLAEGAVYQLWAIPVSLRERGRATRHNQRLAAGEEPRGGLLGTLRGPSAPQDNQPRTAPADASVAELRELAERRREEPDAAGTVTIRWAWEIMAPTAFGVLLLLILWITG
ncbi:PH domain-containing protein [Streptomyces calidiresistens]|uniref:PH domain-containing protein n=1 Tax=Streptomyces calidiresistens TaxID=1485586 RepID=A0A7W3T5F0_9ACTN|nr:PH domain-containing protein [Streptomyces calidiresistens]MBB0231257.1 PH domain-containing protein [Streptomyces calidiresistens]